MNKPPVDSKKSIVKIKIVVHEAEEGGFWAEVPAIPGCATQGDSMEELMQNLHEAIGGCLEAPSEPGGVEWMLELQATRNLGETS